jgi:hypothetical protein
MEWDFTPSAVSIGKVKYTLEDFLRDLRVEVITNFPKLDEQQLEQICRLFYGVMYFWFNGCEGAEISKTFKVDPKFVEAILANNKANMDMLGAIIMNIFLKNLQETQGVLSDTENILMVNARLMKFHEIHKL